MSDVGWPTLQATKDNWNPYPILASCSVQEKQRCRKNLFDIGWSFYGGKTWCTKATSDASWRLCAKEKRCRMATPDIARLLCRTKVMRVRYALYRWMSHWRAKVMRAGHVKHRLTMCAGQRRFMNATTDFGWPLCASQRRFSKPTPTLGNYCTGRRSWARQCSMFPDSFFQGKGNARSPSLAMTDQCAQSRSDVGSP